MAVSLLKVMSSLYFRVRHRPRCVLSINARMLSNEAVISQKLGKQGNVVSSKFTQLLQWYENVTGMDEVRFAQNRVLDAEEKFISAQDRRRDSNKKVTVLQNKLKELYAELDNTTRGEEKYVNLITQEHKVLKEEKLIVEEFQRYEREEREYFSTLSSAVKESHEKERAQAERTKYWSIIGSIIGTVLGVVGSSVNNNLKMNELRNLVKESVVRNKLDDLSTAVPDALSKHEKELSVIVSEMKNVVSVPNEHVLGRLTELILTLDNKVNIAKDTSSDTLILNVLKKQGESLEKHFKELKYIVRSQESGVKHLTDDQLIVVPFSLEERLNEKHRQTHYFLLGVAVVSAVVPVLFKYLGF